MVMGCNESTRKLFQIISIFGAVSLVSLLLYSSPARIWKTYKEILQSKLENSSLSLKTEAAKLNSQSKLEEILHKLQAPTKRSAVAYMVQGPAKNALEWAERLRPLQDRVELLYHSFDKPCNICIYRNHTNWASGRNLLLRHLLNHDKNLDRFKYFAFLDYDLELHCREKSCWVSWNKMILEDRVQFAQVNPKTWNDPVQDPTCMQTCVDNAMVTVHHSALHIMMPQPTYWMNKGWWYNCQIAWLIIERCCPLTVYSDNRWGISNNQHSRKYPYFGPGGFKKSVLDGKLVYHYPDLIPWDTRRVPFPHHCLSGPVPANPSWAIKGECRRPMLKAFRSWYLSGRDSVE